MSLRDAAPQERLVWNGRLAQLGEHLPYKQGVTGSSPVVPTTGFPDKTESIWPEFEKNRAEAFRIWPGSSAG